MKKKPQKQVRHPTKKKVLNPTYTHTPISIGKQERELLRYLYKNKNSRFNVKAYHRLTNIPRSTVYDYLNRLQRYGFINRETANNHITKKGILLLDSSESMSDKGVGSVRRECRKKENLSSHYHKFKIPITNKDSFSIESLKQLNHMGYHENKLKNLHQIIINFEDATIFINPKQLIINLYDVISANVDDNDFKCIPRAIEYIEKFMDIGIITEGMILEEGHWARVESILSDLLYEKVDNKYFLELENGKKFWIDHSHKREDETNDKQIRKRTDEFLSDMFNSESLMSDVDKITNALGFITKLESARLMNEIEQRKNIIKKTGIKEKISDKPSYVG